MKKKIYLLFIVICLFLVGCEKQEIENTVTNEPISNESLIKINSNDKMIVFLDGDKYLVFDYLENNVTGYSVYLDYKTIDSAKNTLDIIKVNYANDEDILSVTRNAQFIVIKYSEEYVKKNYTTISDLRKSLSNLKEVKE